MTAAIEPTSHFFLSDSLQIHYLEWGPKGAETVILVHGVRDHARSWDTVAEALCDRYHVVALDLRGHGDSPWSREGAYLLPYHVEDLVRLVDRLERERCTLVGHSFGANIVSRFAAMFPERVDRLVLVDGFGPSPAIYAQWEEQGAVKRTSDWIAQRRKATTVPPRRIASIEAGAERMLQGNPRLSHDQAAHLAKHGLRREGDAYAWKSDPRTSMFAPEDFSTHIVEYWRRITAPALLCFGEKSWSAPMEGDDRLGVLSASQVRAIPDAGHWPHHDQPAVFLATLENFLAGR